MSGLRKAIGSSSIDVIKTLLDEGININSLDAKGKASLVFAIEKNVEQAVDLLLARGADVNLSSAGGKSPLHAAIMFRNISILRKLIKKGCDIEQKYMGLTPLHCAARGNFLSGVELLLHQGANVNARDEYNSTPAHLALFFGNEEILRLLVDNDADLENEAGKGEGLLLLAVKENLPRIAEFLLIKGARLDVIFRGRTVPVIDVDTDVLKVVIEHFYKVRPLGWDNDLKFGEVVINYPWVTLEDYLACRDEILHEYLESYNCLCIKEYKKIKTISIGNFSLSDIFNISDPIFVMNQEVEEVIESPRLQYDFPIYFHILKEQFKKARKRLNYLNKAQAALSMNLPREIERIVLSYLSDNDLVWVDRAGRVKVKKSDNSRVIQLANEEELAKLIEKETATGSKK